MLLFLPVLLARSRARSGGRVAAKAGVPGSSEQKSGGKQGDGDQKQDLERRELLGKGGTGCGWEGSGHEKIMARPLRGGEPMLRGFLMFFVLASTAGAAVSEAGAESCTVPWKVRRRAGDACRASIRQVDLLGEYDLCMPRAAWLRWLADRSPGCLPGAHSAEGQWKEVRPPLFDEQAPPTGKPRIRRFLLSANSSPSRSASSPGAFHEMALRLTQALERRRESFSFRLEPIDPHGWLRAWFLGESPQAGLSLGVSDNGAGIPTSLFFVLGYVHVLTTAGVHLLMLSALLELVVVRLCRSAPSRRVPSIRVAVGCVHWGLIAWVWALSGWRWGLMRPIALIAIQQGSRSRGLRWDRGVPLALAVAVEALLALVAQEEAFHGRLHYFLAVWGGVWGSAGMSGWRAHLGMAWGSWLWVAPLQLVHDSWVALVTPLLSLVTIPVAGYLLLPLGLVVEALPRSELALAALSKSSSLLMAASLPLARFPGASWVADPRVFLAALSAVLVLRTPVIRRAIPRPALILALVALVVAARALPRTPPSLAPGGVPRATEVAQLDVGQGDAVLISWRDPGGTHLAAFDVGSRAGSTPAQWMRALARRGARRLDAVLISHQDEDHLGALASLLDWIDVGCIVIPGEILDEPQVLPILRAAERRGVRVSSVAGSCFPFPWEVEATRPGDANGVMAGILVPLESRRTYLNLGDSGSRHGASELALATAFERDWPALWAAAREGRTGVLELGHHGSRFSSSQALLEAFRPGQGWVSAGWQNRHGHPHPEALARARTEGLELHRTDQEGCLILH